MKLHIKVSRATSAWLKSKGPDLIEYAGELLNNLVAESYFTWEDVKVYTPDDLLHILMDVTGAPTTEELLEMAKSFCWSNGFIGYKLQSRF